MPSLLDGKGPAKPRMETSGRRPSSSGFGEMGSTLGAAEPSQQPPQSTNRRNPAADQGPPRTSTPVRNRRREDQDLLFDTYADQESIPTYRLIEWLEGHRALFRSSKEKAAQLRASNTRPIHYYFPILR
jgi:hypothetical protein